MSTASVAFAVRSNDRARRAELELRIAALERFYAPLGLGTAAFEHHDRLGLTFGVIGPSDLESRCVLWGAPFGSRRPPAQEILHSADLQLRPAVVGVGLAIAWSDDIARIMTAPCGPVTAYTAASEDCEAWATHAVAAAWLASGEAHIDTEAIPELIAFDFVGCERSLVAGARPLAAATCVDFTPQASVTRDWWPAAGRWDPVPADDAFTHTDATLLNTLARRTGGMDRVGLCLTAGADSRVLALALAELGKNITAVTWGEAGWADVTGAERIAQQLGISWESRASWRDDISIAARADADARWSDGAFGLAPSDRVWPQAPAVMVGAAGEVGRAFYYRRLAAAGRPPDARADDPAAIADALFPEGRLEGARAEARARARAAAQTWAEAALASGLRGWSALDVLYAEQRVAHWGRSQLPCIAGDFLAGFASAEVVRGLASQPISDRLTDGFHRRFVAARRPDLALPVPEPPHPLPQPPSRPTRLLRRLRGPAPVQAPAPAPEGDAFLLALWAERPTARARIAEEVLRSPLIAGTLGEAWCDAVRDGFLRGDRGHTAHALLASGPVALAEALRELG